MKHVTFEKLKKQESTIIRANLLLMVAVAAVLLGFSQAIGDLPRVVLVLLALRFIEQIVELLWLRRDSTHLSLRGARIYALLSIATHLAFAVTLSVVAQFDHSHFVVLYFLPVIAGAFRLPPLQLGGLLLLICSATFLEVFLEASRGRTVAALEYYENTIVCLSYITVAIIVKQIVDQVEERERALELSMQELKSTQSKLLEEERLAAVGRLAAGLAHEIRNPIALIAGHLSMHQERVAKDLATLLSTEISRLETLTTDFLSYARSTPPHKEQSELRPTLEYVAALVRPHAERANVALSVEVKQDIAFAFDSHQIQQALLNLVLNAIQASRSNSVVNLCARALGNDVEIEVENSGEVISDGQLKQLFEPFSSTKTGGTGLGLAISRSIARAHGGDLRLRKNTNNMVSFVVTLPLSKD